MKFLRLLKQAAKLWLHKGSEQHAAALAYFTPFALTPLLLISITLVGVIIGRADVIALLLRWGAMIDQALPEFMSASVASFELMTMGYTIPLFALVFLSGMVLFALNSVSSSLQDIWGIERYGFKNLLRRSGRSILFVFLFQGYLVVTIISNSIFAKAAANSGFVIFNPLSSLIFFVSTTLLIAIGYGLLPLQAPKFRARLYGAMVATVLFLFTRTLVALHVATSPAPDIYGAAGLIFVLLIWIYMSACIIYYGAAFTKVYQESLPYKLTK